MSPVVAQTSDRNEARELIVQQPFMLMFIVLAPWSVTALNKVLLVTLFLASLFFWSLKLAYDPIVRLNSVPRTVASLYLSVFAVGLFAAALSVTEIQGAYLSSVLPGRLFSIAALTSMLLLALDCLATASRKTLHFYLKVALFSLGLFLIGGIWQLADNVFGVTFPVDTRDWIHGVPDHLREILPSRITSFAGEPNFFAPLLMEFMLLSRMLVTKSFYRNSLLFIGIVITLLTFSGGAYVNYVVLVGVLSFRYMWHVLITGRSRGGHLFLAAAAISSMVAILVFFMSNPLFDYALAKFQQEAGGGSSRSVFLMALIDLWSWSDALKMTVGHGLATMSILPEFGLAQADFLFRISNNFFLDTLWESGLVGLALVLGMFGVLLRIGWRERNANLAYETGWLLTLHLGVTSLYRSEYLSTHFVWVLILILCCFAFGHKIGGKELEEVYE